MKVYAVSSGCYSDYSIHCVFAEKALAEAYAVAMGTDPDGWYSDARVEEYPVLTKAPQKVTVLSRSVELWDNGTVEDGREHTRDEWDYEAAPPVKWRWVRAPFHDNKGGRLDVEGADHKRVRKVFSEQRARLLADPVARRVAEDVSKP